MTYVTEAFAPMHLHAFVPIIYVFGYQEGLQKDEITEQLCAVALGYNLGLRLRRQEISTLKLPWAIQQNPDYKKKKERRNN